MLTAVSFVGLQAIPINFPYPLFAALICLVGLSMGLFAAPNTSAVMNSLPLDQRGAGGAMLNTFQNSATVLSIGFFFTVITLGLSATLPRALLTGLTRQGVPASVARRSATSRRWGACSRHSWASTRSRPCSGPTCWDWPACTARSCWAVGSSPG